MHITQTIKILSSLAQETRLKAFKVMVEAGDQGVTAGAIGRKIDIAQNTMSFHLANLENSGLITSKKSGQFIIYKANFIIIEQLIKYLLEHCFFDSEDKCHITTDLLGLIQEE